MLGGAFSAWFVGWVLFTALKRFAEPGSPFGSVLNLSGLIACFGMLVHSLVDFNLHIPANALLFFVSAHLAVVRLEPSRQRAPKNHSLQEKIGT